MTTKVRKTVTLDPDLVAEFGDEGAALSAAINRILRAEKERRIQHAAFSAYVDGLFARFGDPDPEVAARVAAVFDAAGADEHNSDPVGAAPRDAE